jgi:hypothetical protein
MTTLEIKKQIARANVQKAIDEIGILAKDTELEDIHILLSRDYTDFKHDVIRGILSEEQRQLKNAQIANRLLSLLNEYEIQSLRNLNQLFTELHNSVNTIELTESNKDTILEINEIGKGLDPIKNIEKKEDIDPSVMKRLGNFIEHVNEPNSNEGKMISNVKNGINLFQKIGKKYNSVAEWFALPQIPSIFLG